ncbi:MAG: DCC1-like thiol-disulfide oxidoreductase family protein, partial [Pseudanabaenaceae cyanobacterium]
GWRVKSTPMGYCLIYDGECNLCANFVRSLAAVDQGRQLTYAPMQDAAVLAQWGITAADCDMGMILVDVDHPQRRWQGSDAVEELARLVPLGKATVGLYRWFLKALGDRLYGQVRDHRYRWFGRRSSLYPSPYPVGCRADGCALPAASIKSANERVS